MNQDPLEMNPHSGTINDVPEFDPPSNDANYRDELQSIGMLDHEQH